MSEFKKKNKYKFWYSPLSLGLIFCILVIFGYNVFGLVEKERETSKKKALILDQIDLLHKRESNLSGDISKLQTSEGIEDAIREKYYLVKEGEKMVVIVDDKESAIAPADASTDHSFWGWIKRWFKK